MKTKLFIILLLGTITCSAQTTIPTGAELVGLKEQNVYRENIPDGWSSVVGWLHAATLDSNQSNAVAKITIDYMRLYEINRATKEVSIIYEETYDFDGPRHLEDDEGRRFPRTPKWYANNAEGKENYIFNSQISNGYLTIDVSKTPNNIIHWWTPQLEADNNIDYYWEVSAKIEGEVALQLGTDWWEYVGASYCGPEKCNKLSWISDWYGDTNGNFVKITAPR